MITEFNTLPKKIYYVQTAAGCTVMDADGDTLAEITAPGGYFPGIGSADASTGTVTFSSPVKRVIGPFDIAPQQQLALQGVLGGNDVLPEGYTRVKWLESNDGSWILTEYYPTSKTVAKIDMLAFGFPLQPKGVLGNSDQGEALFRFFYKGAGDAYSLFDYNKIRYEVTPAPRNARFLLKLRKGSVEYDSREVLSFQDHVEWSSESPLCLFISSSTYAYVGEMRLFRASFWEGDTLRADFVPALGPTGAPCVFDLVSQTPYYNEGAGDFSYPGKEQEASTFALRRPVTCAQLTEHGLRRLYRVPRGYNGTKAEYAAEHGFKPLVETPQPEEGYWVPRWRETAESIVLDWVETEPPAELENA